MSTDQEDQFQGCDLVAVREDGSFATGLDVTIKNQYAKAWQTYKRLRYGAEDYKRDSVISFDMVRSFLLDELSWCDMLALSYTYHDCVTEVAEQLLKADPLDEEFLFIQNTWPEWQVQVHKRPDWISFPEEWDSLI